MRYFIACAVVAIPFSGHAATLSEARVGEIVLSSGTYSKTIISKNFVPSVNDGKFQAGSQDNSVTAGDTTLTYRMDLASGKVGVAATTPSSSDVENGSIDAAIFDTVSFDFGGAASGEITYSVTVDGTLSNTMTDNGYSDQYNFAASVLFADVTGLSSSFFLGGADFQPQLMSLGPNSSEYATSPASGSLPAMKRALPDYVSREFGFVSVLDKTTDDCDFLPEYQFCETVQNTTGEDIPFFFTLTGSFVAEAGNEYAFLLRNRASANGSGGSVDALSTSTFSFLDTSGGTVFSASGVLPGTTPATVVPVPAAMPLIASGLALLAFISRRRAKS